MILPVLTMYRHSAGMRPAFCHSLGVPRTLTFFSLPARITARFVGTLKQAFHTVNSLSLQTGRSKPGGTPTTPTSLLRLRSTVGSQSRPSKTPARKPPRLLPTRTRLLTGRTSLPRLKLSRRSQVSRFQRPRNGSSDLAAQLSALAAALFRSTC